MEITNTSSTATHFAGFFMAEEIFFMLQEARFAFLIVMLLIIADFRFGRRESAYRYEQAIKNKDSYSENKYRWRTSRAIRRSLNKLLDYILIALLGLFLGQQFLVPFDIARIWGTYCAVALVCFCEIQSIISHFLYLHDAGVMPSQAINLIKRFTIIFAKKKDKDMGEAIEETLNNKEL